jgi:GNAT superfamily N-acetyltransferase
MSRSDPASSFGVRDHERDVAHPLLQLMLAAARGEFPPADGTFRVVPALGDGLECSVAFTGHAVIATDARTDAVAAHQPHGFGASLAPDFLRWLAGEHGWIGVIDATLVAAGRGGGTLPDRPDAAEHARVRHATDLRRDVRVYGDDRGVVTLAQGLAGRRELSIEAAPQRQGKGWGRSLLDDALGLVPPGEPVFAAVSPGNARSLRAFLAVGFVPIGSEVIIRPHR